MRTAKRRHAPPRRAWRWTWRSRAARLYFFASAYGAAGRLAAAALASSIPFCTPLVVSSKYAWPASTAILKALGHTMSEEHTTAAVQRYLNDLAANSSAEPV